MLVTRLATAIVLLAVCVSALFFASNSVWTALLLLALLAAGWEWGALARLDGAARAAFAVFTTVSAAGVWLFAGKGVDNLVYGTGCAFWLIAVLPWLARGWQVRSPFALCLAGWLVLVPSWLALARLQVEPGRLLALLGVIWLSDTGAYFAGRAWGRHKLAPSVSPGKTWEGVAGAVVVVGVYYVALLKFAPEWVWWSGTEGALLFAGVTVMGIVGDLFESWLKRQAAVKDSGTLLPGHGGVLDRIDSITAVLPFAALALSYAG